ncbi:MAG: HPr family phosphocarrier protein [Nitrospinae bacterium]|nr:HPr family phosphocarrier protein [Nitrospinota bacterium]
MTKRSLSEIITEQEFLPLIQESCVGFFRIYNYMMREKSEFTKTFYSNLIQEAQLLESFLDAHGARRNKTWIFFTELVASIRNFSIPAFLLRHILDRYHVYNLYEKKEEENAFWGEAKKTLDFMDESMKNLFESAKEEGEKQGLILPMTMIKGEEFKDIRTNRYLPPTAFDEEDVPNEEERIIELSRRYRKVANLLRHEGYKRRYTEEELIKIIPRKINENKVRKLKNIIHGVQSDYDTYVKNTNIEKKNKKLSMFRGYISMPLHLLEIVRWLSHFYERHVNGIRGGETREKISRIIDKAKILDRIVNFAFFYSNNYLQKGISIAEDILSSYVNSTCYELPIPQPLGFHARPATYVSLVVNEHGTDVFLLVNGERFNAKSVMSLLQASGIIADKGYKTVIFEGDKRVLDDLKILSDHNYCEDNNIPRELNYLKILRNI